MSILFGWGLFFLLGYVLCISDGYGMFGKPNPDSFIAGFYFGFIGLPVWTSMIIIVLKRRTLFESWQSNCQFFCGAIGIILLSPTMYSLIESRL